MSRNRRTIPGALLSLGLAVTGCAGPQGDAMPGQTTPPPSSAAPSGSTAPTEPAEPTASARPADPTGAATPRPRSGGTLPILPPAVKPPREPTDRIRTDTIGGLITRGGSGPCYGLIDDDGREYALYGPDAGTLLKGTRVVVRVSPLTARVDCGPGLLLGLHSVRRLT